MKALVLAGGFPQIALIEELKRRGYFVLLADYYENPVAKPFADEFFRISTLDVDAIKALAIAEAVDLVITACTDQALLTVAKVSEELGLPCYIDYGTALKVTNKSYMKEMFQSHGIPSARFFVAGQLCDSMIRDLRYPCIVKPVDCNSSKGVAKVYGEAQLRHAFELAVEYSRTDTAIVEEYIEGREITVDVQVKDGRAQVLSMAYSDKIPDEGKFVIYRTRYPISETDKVVSDIADTAQRIADSFGLRDSLMLIQLICDGSEIYVLEFSARTGGGVKYQLIKKVSGFDVISAAVDLSLGKSPEIEIRPPETKYVTNTFIYCNEGIFDRAVGFEELKARGVITEYFIFKWRGAEMGGAASSGDRVGGFTVQGDSLGELRQKYAEALGKIGILDPDGRDIMRRELIGELEY